MDQIEVHIIQTQLFQGLIDRKRNIVDGVDHFCSDEERFTRQPRFLDCEAKFRLGIVEFGAVKVVEACFYGVFDIVYGCSID